jgi:hypothetical protein
MSYTEETFKEFLHESVLGGGMAEMLGWTVEGGQYDIIVEKTLTALSAEDITTFTNVVSLRAVGEREAWRQVLRHTTLLYSFSADGGQYSRNQIVDHIKDNLSLAESEAEIYAPTARGGVATVDTVIYRDDPYQGDLSDVYHARLGDD